MKRRYLLRTIKGRRNSLLKVEVVHLQVTISGAERVQNYPIVGWEEEIMDDVDVFIEKDRNDTRDTVEPNKRS